MTLSPAIRWLVLSLFVAPALNAQTPPQDHARAVQAFNVKVDTYVQLHRRVEGPIPPLSASHDMAEVYSLMSRVREGIRAASDWKPGSFFTPDAIGLFRVNVAECLKPADLEGMQADFVEHSPPALPMAKVGQPLPDDTPIMPVPPRLLARMPKLPAELRYVVFGDALLLWDHHADMVVDIAPGLLGATTYR